MGSYPNFIETQFNRSALDDERWNDKYYLALETSLQAMLVAEKQGLPKRSKNL